MKQLTLKASFTLSGKGLHTGAFLTATFNPAPDNHGYKIRRIDLDGQPVIDAVAENVIATPRNSNRKRRCDCQHHRARYVSPLCGRY